MSARLQQIQSSIALAKSIFAPRCKQALMLFAGAKTHKRAQKNSARGRDIVCRARNRLVFRFRSSHQFAAYSRANFGIKGTLAILMFSSAALDLKFLQEPAAN